MTNVMNCEEMKKNGEALKACHLTELVRGSEAGLIDEMTPMVQCGSVRLDLNRVERIDAAGIAALISLYRTAQRGRTQLQDFEPAAPCSRGSGAGGRGPDSCIS